eukprot:jgi/Botrbrau1/19263/Bobra.0073s0013.1
MVPCPDSGLRLQLLDVLLSLLAPRALPHQSGGKHDTSSIEEDSALASKYGEGASNAEVESAVKQVTPAGVNAIEEKEYERKISKLDSKQASTELRTLLGHTTTGVNQLPSTAAIKMVQLFCRERVDNYLDQTDISYIGKCRPDESIIPTNPLC